MTLMTMIQLPQTKQANRGASLRALLHLNRLT